MQIVNPEIKDTPEAPQQAAEKLQQMGSMTRDETIMLGTMLLAVVLWVMGDTIGVPAVVAAMLGLVVLLVTGVLKWADCLEYKSVRPCSLHPLLQHLADTSQGHCLVCWCLPSEWGSCSWWGPAFSRALCHIKMRGGCSANKFAAHSNSTA